MLPCEEWTTLVNIVPAKEISKTSRMMKARKAHIHANRQLEAIHRRILAAAMAGKNSFAMESLLLKNWGRLDSAGYEVTFHENRYEISWK